MTIATDRVAGGALGILIYCIVGVLTHAVPAREVCAPCGEAPDDRATRGRP